jgi:Terminase large subunit, T4likevirus-type, N-terminal
MAPQNQPQEIRPQPGPQTTFLSCPADIAIYGGAAGGGKTWALLIDALRHYEVTGYTAVIFRRTFPEIVAPGALWTESEGLYALTGATPKLGVREWRFPNGAVIAMRHLQHDQDRLAWQGAQVAWIGFDELTHFSADQFWYLLSRNRSTCGIRPCVRASCNPDPDSWVAEFIAWWINQDTGQPIPERAGKLRWFVRVSDRLE